MSFKTLGQKLSKTTSKNTIQAALFMRKIEIINLWSKLIIP